MWHDLTQNTPMAGNSRTRLTSLERLERQILAISGDRVQGDAWEKALKGWINAGGHPELTKAWMWGEWPGKLKAGLKGDKGVDLVAETRDKQLVAIQVKFRRDPTDPVTAPEVQKLVGSYRKHFALFALASNAWTATKGVREAVGDEDAMLILREQLLESSYDWAAKKSIKRTKFTPFPFQKVAAENVRKALAKGGRAQIVMACGTGKTVTMLLAAEALDAQRVLVLAPTLLLVKQLRDEWVSKRRPDREWASLAVCSDIGDGIDASEIAPAEFGAPPTTNPDEIAAFLKKPGRRVVFGTYASSDRIAKAQKKAGVPAFDLAVADEAHRIAGVVGAKDKSERSQRVMLEEKEIKAVRRLFATATPRITGSKKTRDGDEILIESMDDESRFGKVAHSVTFQEAVKLKRLVPYKLVVTIVTNDEVADAVQNRRFIDVKGKPYAADEVATAIAIRRAYKELGISKIISYHSRVAGAKSFADLITQVPGRGKSPVTEHVAGSMPVNDRKQALNRLAAATEPYLVTNARCLTEGIDVPALDAVAFADPRKSQVDIVQAVGRAMRKPMGKSKKTTGYIILPVYLTKKELKDPEIAVGGSAFEPVLQVLRALKDHDPFLARFMAKILVAKGKKPHRKEGGVGEILEVSIGDALDKVLARRLLEAVQLRSVEVSADSFETGLLFLSEYLKQHQNTIVPEEYEMRGFRLGRWVSQQRVDFKQGAMRPERKRQLDSIGFVWSVLDAWYDEGIASLKAFIAAHGHARVPQDYVQDEFKLGDWITARRYQYKQGKLSNDRIHQLEQLGVSWNAVAEAFDRGLAALKAYVDANGHARVPRGYMVDDINLGSWIAVKKQQFRKGLIDEVRIGLIRSAGLDLDAPTEKGRHWQAGLVALRAFTKKYPNTPIPGNYSKDGFKLGMWAQGIRRAYDKGKLRREQINQLADAGMVFSSKYEVNWKRAVNSLKEYERMHGNADVPQGYLDHEGFALGRWLNKQRQLFLKGELDTARAKELATSGVVWAPRHDQGLLRIETLLAYRKEYGHWVIPTGCVYMGKNLQGLVNKVRASRRNRSLPKELIAMLDEAGFDWNPKRGPKPSVTALHRTKVSRKV
jgi:superfamily II DNA or RNA helicase